MKKGFVKQQRTRRGPGIVRVGEQQSYSDELQGFITVIWKPTAIQLCCGAPFTVILVPFSTCCASRRGDSPSIWCWANTVNNIRKKASYFFSNRRCGKWFWVKNIKLALLEELFTCLQPNFFLLFFWMGLDFAYSELAVERVTTLTTFWAVVICYFS